MYVFYFTLLDRKILCVNSRRGDSKRSLWDFNTQNNWKPTLQCMPSPFLNASTRCSGWNPLQRFENRDVIGLVIWTTFSHEGKSKKGTSISIMPSWPEGGFPSSTACYNVIKIRPIYYFGPTHCFCGDTRILLTSDSWDSSFWWTVSRCSCNACLYLSR